MLQSTSYEDRARKATIMKEVLPDDAMWEAWEKTEAPLRKGRGWYPALDKRFLELLVETEIDLHSLSLSSRDRPPPLPLDRYERNREKVRRVAQSRIGQERLQAYCDRVKEAFDAYVRGGLWNLWDDDGADAVSGGEGDMVVEGVEIGVEGEEAAEAEVAFRHEQAATGENRWASEEGERNGKVRGRDRRSKGRVARSEASVDSVEDKLSSLSTSRDGLKHEHKASAKQKDVDMADNISVMAIEAITQQVVEREKTAATDEQNGGAFADVEMTIQLPTSS